jgi:hypothetical protein
MNGFSVTVFPLTEFEPLRLRIQGTEITSDVVVVRAILVYQESFRVVSDVPKMAIVLW